MMVRHLPDRLSDDFEEHVQEVLNGVLNESGCHRKLVDIKYSTTVDTVGDIGILGQTYYSALLIFE